MAWRWLLGGVMAILVGLVVWWTAFILIPVGIILIAIGTVKQVRARRKSGLPPQPN